MAEASSFEFTGGALCLDFANTVNGRGRERPEDLLSGFDRLAAWAQQAGLISESDAATMLAVAARHPHKASPLLHRARRLREALFAIFAAAAAGDTSPAEALDVLNAELARAAPCIRLSPTRQGGYRWYWAGEADDPRHILWRVAQSAADLLRSEQLARVRECAADTCRWLFLDSSRNRTRRWCDMKVCGNRDKVRRFYQRQSR